MDVCFACTYAGVHVALVRHPSPRSGVCVYLRFRVGFEFPTIWMNDYFRCFVCVCCHGYYILTKMYVFMNLWWGLDIVRSRNMPMVRGGNSSMFVVYTHYLYVCVCVHVVAPWSENSVTLDHHLDECLLFAFVLITTISALEGGGRTLR